MTLNRPSYPWRGSLLIALQTTISPPRGSWTQSPVIPSLAPPIQLVHTIPSHLFPPDPTHTGDITSGLRSKRQRVYRASTLECSILLEGHAEPPVAAVDASLAGVGASTRQLDGVAAALVPQGLAAVATLPIEFDGHCGLFFSPCRCLRLLATAPAFLVRPLSPAACAADVSGLAVFSLDCSPAGETLPN